MDEGHAAPSQITTSLRAVHSPETRRLLEYLAPDSLLCTPSRPPGFDLSPVLQLASPVAVGSVASPSTPASVGSVAAGPLDSLFTANQHHLLSLPRSTPPRPPKNRRKTLAGVDIARSVGFSLRRASARIKAKRKAKPVAKEAETAVCRGLGIVQDGEEVTENALEEFARLFAGEVSDRALAALRVLFKMATPDDDELDEALLGHGGAAGLDLAGLEEVDATADV
jgi:hypothetical protein